MKIVHHETIPASEIAHNVTLATSAIKLFMHY